MVDCVENQTEYGLGMLGCELGPEGLYRPCQGLKLIIVGGLADGIDDLAKCRLSLRGRGPEALSRLRQGLELIVVSRGYSRIWWVRREGAYPR